MDIDINKRVFCEKFTFPSGENDHNKGSHASMVENSHISYVSLVVTSILAEIQLFC